MKKNLRITETTWGQRVELTEGTLLHQGGEHAPLARSPVIMKLKRLRTLRRATVMIQLLCVFWLTALVLLTPNGKSLWTDKIWSEEQFNKAQSLGELQKTARSMVDNVAFSEATLLNLLCMSMLGLVVLVIFLHWSLKTLDRIEREEPTDTALPEK